MRYKSLLTSALLVSSITAGGLWVYQANRFEESVRQNIESFEKFLHAQGISLTYETMKTSPFSFKVHLINPVISGTLPDFDENWKDIKGAFSLIGEMTVGFNPVANTVVVAQTGDGQLKVEGPIETHVSFPSSSQSMLAIKRKTYDFLGKKPFLCLDNIKAFTSESKEFSALLNGQKFIEAKKSRSEISLDYQGKALDGSCISDIEQIEFFDVENPFKRVKEGIDILNPAFRNVFSSRVVIGPEDQKLSCSFHVDDIADYIETLKGVFSKGVTAHDFNTIAPEGIRLEIKDFSTRSKIAQSSLKGKFERAKENFLFTVASDVKFATDKWKTLVDIYYEQFIRHLPDFNKALSAPDTKNIDFLKDKKVFRDLMPDFPSFGKMHFSVDVKGQTTFPFVPGEATFQFKSDLYDLGVKGSFALTDNSIKITVRNMQALMADLQNYVSRISTPLSQDFANEIKTVNTYLPIVQKVLGKVLEPEGASEQYVDIHISPQGVKVGNYDFMQIMALFAGAGSDQAQAPHALETTP